jgi:hypothetical protein
MQVYYPAKVMIATFALATPGDYQSRGTIVGGVNMTGTYEYCLLPFGVNGCIVKDSGTMAISHVYEHKRYVYSACHPSGEDIIMWSTQLTANGAGVSETPTREGRVVEFDAEYASEHGQGPGVNGNSVPFTFHVDGELFTGSYSITRPPVPESGVQHFRAEGTFSASGTGVLGSTFSFSTTGLLNGAGFNHFQDCPSFVS